MVKLLFIENKADWTEDRFEEYFNQRARLKNWFNVKIHKLKKTDFTESFAYLIYSDHKQKTPGRP